jgi:hypothetical protein
MRSKVLTAVNMSMLVLWVVTSKGHRGRIRLSEEYTASIFTATRNINYDKYTITFHPLQENTVPQTPLRPDRLWGPSSLLYNGYRGALSPGVKRGRGAMLTTHPLLVPRLRKSRSYTSCHPKRLYGA